jgi:hypothetical protein
MKKSSDEFIHDLLAGHLSNQQQILVSNGLLAFEDAIAKEYDVSDESLKRSILNSKQQLESAIGVSLTDEQLSALSGGKTKKEQANDIGAGVGGVIGGSLLGLVIVVK